MKKSLIQFSTQQNNISIRAKWPLIGAKFLWQYWTEEGENRLKLKVIGPAIM